MQILVSIIGLIILGKAQKNANIQKAQVIAMEICVMPEGYETLSSSSDDSYIGLTDEERDFKKRWKLIRNTIEDNRRYFDRREEIMKFFLAPEFYFRGAEGLYNADQLVDSWVPQMVDYFNTDEFKSWIIILPAVAFLNLEELYNVAYVFIGGTTNFITLKKKTMSEIDFFQEVKEKYNIQGYSADEAIESASGGVQEFDLDQTFQLGEHGMLVGLEICLDHSNQVLKSKGGDEVDVQIIVSAGMSVIPQSLHVKNQGYVFHVDGLKDSTGMTDFGAHSQVVQLVGSHIDPTDPKEQAELKVPSDIFKPMHSDRLSIYPIIEIPVHSRPTQAPTAKSVAKPTEADMTSTDNTGNVNAEKGEKFKASGAIGGNYGASILLLCATFSALFQE